MKSLAIATIMAVVLTLAFAAPEPLFSQENRRDNRNIFEQIFNPNPQPRNIIEQIFNPQPRNIIEQVFNPNPQPRNIFEQIFNPRG